MKKGGVEVLKREAAGSGEVQEEDAHKRRRMAQVEGLSELGYAIKELSLLSPEGKDSLSTAAFLSVANLLLLALDKVVPTMAVLRQDVQRNIQRLEDVYVLDSTLYSDLLAILKKEADEATARKQESCSRAVVWLTRSMDFSVALIEKLRKDSEMSLLAAVEEAYAETLQPWHGWIASAAYKVALKLIPDRKKFNELVMDNNQDVSLLEDKQIQIMFSQVRSLLSEIHNHLMAFNLEKLRSK